MFLIVSPGVYDTSTVMFISDNLILHNVYYC